MRYVYKNNEGVMYEPKYLERFFRNLLFGAEGFVRMLSPDSPRHPR
ncbi:MAG: hypothetical protein MJZ18_09150 [Bacteroidales bacterium]|nr:hypothetical protein [Bacteroidales bacterium]